MLFLFLPRGEGSTAGCGAAACHAAHARLSCGSRCLQQDQSIPGAGTRCSLAPGGSAEAAVMPAAPSRSCSAVAEAVRGPALLRLGSSHKRKEAWQAMAGPWRADEGDVGSRPSPRDSVGWAGFSPKRCGVCQQHDGGSKGMSRGEGPLCHSHPCPALTPLSLFSAGGRHRVLRLQGRH